MRDIVSPGGCSQLKADYFYHGLVRHCEERSDEAIQNLCRPLDCFVELVIGPATSGRTRWLAMTI